MTKTKRLLWALYIALVIFFGVFFTRCVGATSLGLYIPTDSSTSLSDTTCTGGAPVRVNRLHFRYSRNGGPWEYIGIAYPDSTGREVHIGLELPGPGVYVFDWRGESSAGWGRWYTECWEPALVWTEPGPNRPPLPPRGGRIESTP